MNQKGFSLPEIVVALAMMTLIGLSMSSIMTFNYKAGNSATQNFDFTQVELLAKQATLDPVSCPLSLQYAGGRVLVNPNGSPQATIDKLVQIDQKQGATSTIIDTTSATNYSLYVAPFTLTNVAQINPSTYIMNFNINAQKVLGNLPIVGGTSLVSNFPLYVYLDITAPGPAYPIIACSSAGGIPLASPMVKAWVVYANGALTSSFNVSSVANPSAGLYTINFWNPLPNARYSVFVSNTPDGSTGFFVEAPVGTLNTSYFTVGLINQTSHSLANFNGTFMATVVQ